MSSLVCTWKVFELYCQICVEVLNKSNVMLTLSKRQLWVAGGTNKAKI